MNQQLDYIIHKFLQNINIIRLKLHTNYEFEVSIIKSV